MLYHITLYHIILYHIYICVIIFGGGTFNNVSNGQTVFRRQYQDLFSSEQYRANTGCKYSMCMLLSNSNLPCQRCRHKRVEICHCNRDIRPSHTQIDWCSSTGNLMLTSAIYQRSHICSKLYIRVFVWLY